MSNADTSKGKVEQLVRWCQEGALANPRSYIGDLFSMSADALRALLAEREALAAERDAALAGRATGEPMAFAVEAGSFPGDRIIRDGFPDGWHIQDRTAENVALLCRNSDFAIFGAVCICLRPKAMATDEWAQTAQMIARGFDFAYAAAIQPATGGIP